MAAKETCKNKTTIKSKDVISHRKITMFVEVPKTMVKKGKYSNQFENDIQYTFDDTLYETNTQYVIIGCDSSEEEFREAMHS